MKVIAESSDVFVGVLEMQTTPCRLFQHLNGDEESQISQLSHVTDCRPFPCFSYPYLLAHNAIEQNTHRASIDAYINDGEAGDELVGAAL